MCNKLIGFNINTAEVTQPFVKNIENSTLDLFYKNNICFV